MFRQLYASSRLTGPALLATVLAAGPVAAGGGRPIGSWSPGYLSGGVTYSPAPVYSVVPGTAPSAPAVASSPTAPGNEASRLEVAVPANAKIDIDGVQTGQTGTLRAFVSPPLVPGREYTYQITVKWVDPNGKEVVGTHRVAVHANDVINLAFGVEGQK